MDSPQLEDGYTRIANELLEAIYSFDFSKRQFRVLLYVARKTYGWHKEMDYISSTLVANETGMDRANARKTINELKKLNVLSVDGELFGINKDYSSWVGGGQNNPQCKGSNQPPRGSEQPPITGLKQPPVDNAEGVKTTPTTGLKQPPSGGQNNPEQGVKTTPTKESKENKERERNIRTRQTMSLIDAQKDFPEITKQTFDDWMTVRKTKRAPLTQTAWNGVAREIRKSGLSGEAAIQIAVERSWQGLKAEWLQDHLDQQKPTQSAGGVDENYQACQDFIAQVELGS